MNFGAELAIDEDTMRSIAREVEDSVTLGWSAGQTGRNHVGGRLNKVAANPNSFAGRLKVAESSSPVVDGLQS
jgi:hypothetical protein